MSSRNIVPCIPVRGLGVGPREMEGFQQNLGDGCDSLLVIRVCPVRDVQSCLLNQATTVLESSAVPTDQRLF